MIVRDEHYQLEKCLLSLRPFVKQIIVVDTGSEDNSVEIAKKYADFVEVYTDCNDPSTKTSEDPIGKMLRFDMARNRAYSHATQPWVMWVDGDDEVVGAENLARLIQEYDQERKGNPCMVMMPYEYSRDHNGKVNMVHDRERLVTPKEHFHWVGWVHEVLVPKGADLRKRTTEVKTVHHRNAEHKKMESGRNLRILKAQYDALGDGDARHLYYLGMEYGNNGLVDDAIKFLTLYLERSGWDDEKYMAAQLIANHYINRGEYEKAIEWGMKAILICEEWGEAYFTIAKCCYFIAFRGRDEMRWWQRCVHFARTGLEKPPTQTMLFVNPLERDLEIHRFYNLALGKIGDTKGALESVKAALKISPNDDQFLLNKRVFEEHLSTVEFMDKLNQLQAVGKISKEVSDHIETVQRDNKIPGTETKILQEVQTISSKKNLDIVFYVGYSVEAWNPATAKQNGIGGSETAVIEVARRLALMGHQVRVYGDCIQRGSNQSIAGTYDWVQYIDYREYKNISCDILIASRRPEAVDNAEFKFSILWVHDVHCGSQLTLKRATKIDKVFALSDWHKNYLSRQYSFLNLNQLTKTRNGIDLSRFDKKVVRNPHRAIYSSSPDRGMQTAIQIWPKVRERVPDAELHLYYGFQTWEACADDLQRKTIADLKALIAAHEGRGVFFHGRVSQEELAEEFLKSGVWCYPTWFSETSCITAMEAHAAGLRMVTSPIAALNETVGDRGTLIPGDWLDEDFKNRFADAVVEALLREGNEDREKLQEYAKNNFSWDSLAEEWSKMFLDYMNNSIEEDIIPMYQAVQ